jgi:nucleotide-binding universal stress UspA family protein
MVCTFEKTNAMKDFKFNPIRSILVPTDFSENADKAIAYASTIASALKSKLVLFHSIKFPVVVLNETIQVIDDKALIKDADAHLGKLKSGIRGKQVPIEVETVSAMGFAVDEILSQCESGKSDLIVMGTKGAHGLSEYLIGSNTAEVIAKAKCPVLAVPQDAVMRGINKVLFATNYADNDFHSVFLLTEIFKPWNPEIIIVHVEDQGNEVVEVDHFERFKEQVVSGIKYDKFYFNLLDGKNTEDAVNDFATSNKIDIISVSTHKRNLFERLTGRSMSKRLAYHSHIPLLAFHARQVGATPLF